MQFLYLPFSYFFYRLHFYFFIGHNMIYTLYKIINIIFSFFLFFITPFFSLGMKGGGEWVNSKFMIYTPAFRTNGVGESLNLSRPKSLNLGSQPELDSKPTDLSVPRPQSLNLFSSSSSSNRPKTLPLLMQRPNSLQFVRRPVSLEVGDDGSNDEPLNLESPVKFKQLLVAASESQNQLPQVIDLLFSLHHVANCHTIQNIKQC